MSNNAQERRAKMVAALDKRSALDTTEVDELKAQLATLTEENAKLASAVPKTVQVADTSDLKKLTEDLADATSAMGHMTGSISAMESTIESQASTIKALEAQIEILEDGS